MTNFGPVDGWNMRGATALIKKEPALAILVDVPYPVLHKGTGAPQMPDQPGPAYFVANSDGTEGWVGKQQFEESYGVVSTSPVGTVRDEAFWNEARSSDKPTPTEVISQQADSSYDPYVPHIVRKLTPVFGKPYDGPDTTIRTTEGPMPVRAGDWIYESAKSYAKGLLGDDGERDIWPVTAEFNESMYEPAPPEVLQSLGAPQVQGGIEPA